jgi:RNA exonuclease 1
MLQPITTTLREVQSKLKKVLPRDAVLVGHSLENDLVALNVSRRGFTNVAMTIVVAMATSSNARGLFRRI